MVKCWTGLFPPCILICNGPLAKSLLAHPELQNKADIYTFFGKFFSGFGLLTCSEVEAKGYRKELSPFFKKSALEEYLVTFTRHLTILQERIQREIAQNKGVCLFVDIKPVISTLIMDTLSETFFGFQFKSQERQDEPSFIKEIDISIKTGDKVILQQWRSFFQLPILAEIFLLLDHSLHETVQYVKCFLIFKLAMLRIIFTKLFHRQSDDQVPDSLLDYLITSRVSNNGWNPFTLYSGIWETVAHASILTLAGYATSTSTLTWILYYLAKNESVRAKVYAEIDAFVAEEGGNEASVTSLASLKYLEAVIKETLRLVPAGPYLGRKVMKNNLEITIPESSGEPSRRIILPATANVIVLAQVIQSQERYFANASTFSPERFLLLDDDQLDTDDQPNTEMSQNPAMTASAYLPFSGGSRNCIGSQYSMLQLKMTLLCLCKDFNWTVDGALERTPTHYMIQGAASFPVKFTKRNN